MITKNTSKWFRGLAIMMVLISHYAEWNGVIISLEGIRGFACKLGVYGVNIFYLMSGYGIVKSVNRKVITLDFIKKRFLGVYLPYFVLVGLITLIDGGFNSLKSMIQFLIGYDYWFMMNLFIFYILFFLIWKFARIKIILITIGILGYSLILFMNDYAYFWIISNFSFIIGIYAAVYEDKISCLIPNTKSKLILIFSLILLSCGGFFCYQFNKNILCQAFVCISFTIVILVISTMMKKSSSILLLPGTYSLYIYLLHSRIYFLMEPLFQKWDSISKVLVIAIFTLVIGIIIGYCFQYLINKMMNLNVINSK